VDNWVENLTNALYYGDNLGYLREMDRQSVDLVYLDPPFNSKATYNLLFRSPKGGAVQAQTTAFKDTWVWDVPAEMAFDEVMTSGSPAAGILRSLRGFLGTGDLMAYLAMMTPRLIELHRILKNSGSLYLHCDPTASHYLKIILDGIFGPEHFKNELIWQRSTPKGLAFTRFPSTHDVILFYGKSDNVKWNPQHTAHRPEYIDKYYTLTDPGSDRLFQATSLLNPNPNRPNLTYEFHGHTKVWRWTRDRMLAAEAEGKIYFPLSGGIPREKRFLDEQEGTPVTSIWTDIPPVNSQAQERLGYPTQKPLALLERIISASSDEGDVILDPFCGCGTTVEAAESLKRAWIGIDITHHAIDVIEGRLKGRFDGMHPIVKGRPVDLGSAQDLARRDPYEFQWWANWMLGVQNYRERKKGADKGIDGIIYFHNPPHGVGQIIVSVKAGQHIDPGMISALEGTVRREDAQLGVFVCAGEPTKNMRANAAAMGISRVGREQFPRIQIVTAQELLHGPRPALPRAIESDAFRQPLRPPRPMKAETPQPQLSFALAIPGAKMKGADVQDHLAGNLLAKAVAAR
jgi:site-specific DNA-methyltransferase (adenine-specific)